MRAVPTMTLGVATMALVGCAGSPAIRSPAAAELYALDVFQNNGCRMQLDDYQTQVQSDYPLIQLYPGKRPTEDELKQAQSGAYAQNAPAALIEKGVLARDPFDTTTIVSRGEGCI